MIILGLGSNMGDRLEHLRKAFLAIKNIPLLKVLQVSPLYLSDALLPDEAPKDWNKPYLNAALRIEVTLEPLDLLHQLKNIEWSIGRKPEIRHWGPRILDIDILAWDHLVLQNESLTFPHEGLAQRPFALWPLADVAPFWTFPLGPHQGKTAAEIAQQWGSRFSGEAPFHTKQIQQRIDTPQLVGILNVTPDSFSDGGSFTNTQTALQQALHLIEAGAEIIDLGAQSTAPQATLITPEQEWQRLEPILTAIKEAQSQFLLPPKISIDTFQPEVASKALNKGVDWINDVTGLSHPAMCELLQKNKVNCVMMHQLSIPVSREHVLSRHEDAHNTIFEWAEKKLNDLEKINIPKEKIIFDPGIGFGKVTEHSFLLLKQLNLFKALGVPLLIGHSRKSFLSLFTSLPPAKRDIETLVISLYLARQPVDYLRIHQVDFCARGLKLAAALE